MLYIMRSVEFLPYFPPLPSFIDSCTACRSSVKRSSVKKLVI